MTDPGWADRTYLEPLDLEGVRAVLERERPDALLPTLGGQTALNLASLLTEAGVLEELGIELIGASYEAIHCAEDREAFAATMERIGLRVPASVIAHSPADARAAIESGPLSLPVVIRPAFTLGGQGGGFASTLEQMDEIVTRGLRESPIQQILLEESVAGWGEFELEVIRDRKDNVVVVCSIENIDPMGVHTGDSVTVAPAQTLTDREYQVLRDAAAEVIRAVGVETGGSNVQFALNRESGELVVIEMNPRVSRSSALASKATGYPIAKVATKLAVGYTLDEIPNDITGTTPASFEPTLDYVGDQAAPLRVREVPRRRRRADHADEVGGRGDGHRPQLQRGLGQGDAKPRAGRHRAPCGIGRRGLVGPLRRDPVAVAGGRPARRAGRRVEGASLVPGRVAAGSRGRAGVGRRRSGHAGRARLARIEAARNRRRADRRADRNSRAGGAHASPHARRASRVQGGRQLRGRGRGAGAVLLLGLRGRGRAAARRPRERRHPRRRAQPDRAGDRVRLLLRPGRPDVPPARLRRGDGELQPRDRIHRRRFVRPLVLRAADRRGRAGGDRAGAPDRGCRAVRRPDAASAGAPARGGGGAPAGHAVRRDRRGRGSRAVRRRAGRPGPGGAGLGDRKGR